MDTQWLLGIAGLAVTVAIAVGGAFHRAGQRRDDQQDERLGKLEERVERHVHEDAEAHERIRALETGQTHTQRELDRAAKNIHDLRNGIQATVREWVPVWVRKFLDDQHR